MALGSNFQKLSISTYCIINLYVVIMLLSQYIIRTIKIISMFSKVSTFIFSSKMSTEMTNYSNYKFNIVKLFYL